MVIVAVVVQGLKKVPLKWTKLIKVKKSLGEAEEVIFKIETGGAS